jgi:hypothetical protein
LFGVVIENARGERTARRRHLNRLGLRISHTSSFATIPPFPHLFLPNCPQNAKSDKASGFSALPTNSRAIHEPLFILAITTVPTAATAASPFEPSARFDTLPSKHTTSVTLARALSRTYKLSGNWYQLK